MIEIDFVEHTFTCPYCNRKQSYEVPAYNGHSEIRDYANRIVEEYAFSQLNLMYLICSNKSCEKVTIVGQFIHSKKQVDILPQYVCREYPDYIPKQIRDDYREATMAIDLSPKAAATLFRRCLQGMIHDFWGIKERNLNCEISALKDKVSPTLWKALDSLRKIGNIGAHMENDVNLIIDIDNSEATKLKKLIELLFEKWYIAKHDEEELYNDIADTADEKSNQRKQ